MLWVLVVAVFEGETSVLMVHVFAYAPESGVAFPGFSFARQAHGFPSLNGS